MNFPNIIAGFFGALIGVAAAQSFTSVQPGPGVNGINSIQFSSMVQIPPNTFGGNPTASTGNVIAIPFPDCNGSTKAVNTTQNTDGSTAITCNSAIAAQTATSATSATSATTATTATNVSGGTAAVTSLTINGTAVNPILSGTSGSLGGGLLAAGACTSGTVSITGAASGMSVIATPTTYPGDGVQWQAYVSSSNTVTVKVCEIILGTPTVSIYNIRVV